MSAPLGNKNHYKHGKYANKTYIRTYLNMLDRCFNLKASKYMYYGGSGISIADEWLGDNGFSNFLQDMGDSPQGSVLHRNNKLIGYCKDNCIWLDKKEHACLHASENAAHISKLFKGQHHSPNTEFKVGVKRSPEFKERCKQRMLNVWAKRRKENARNG